MNKKRNNSFIAAIFLLPVALAMAGCAHQDKRADQEKSLEGLKEKAAHRLQHQEYDQAADALEKIIARYPEDPNTIEHRLGLAHCYLQEKKFESAHQMYEHFTQYYPNHPQTEYAKYKAVLCRYYQTQTPDRDQAATEATLKSCKEYMDNATYQKYRSEIMAIRHTCTQKLIDKEIYVFNFYLDHDNFDAAKKRLAYLKEQYASKHDDLLPRVLYLEARAAQRSGDRHQLHDAIAALTDKYSSSPYTQMAQALAVPETKMFVF